MCGCCDPRQSTWKVRRDKLSIKLQKRASARSPSLRVLATHHTPQIRSLISLSLSLACVEVGIAGRRYAGSDARAEGGLANVLFIFFF